MKLWLLREREGLPDTKAQNPWLITYDCTYGLVVRAATAEEARAIAAEHSVGAEGKRAWLDATFSTCEELTTQGTPGVILTDFHAG
jgi:hypothetical protein